MSARSKYQLQVMLLLGKFAALMAAACCPQSILTADSQGQTYLRFASYNIRYDSQPDKISVEQSIHALPDGLPNQPAYYGNTTEQPWSLRRLYVANDLLFNGVDLYGGQELLKRQVDDLSTLLGHDYAWIGVGRDDGKEAGEYAAIFYNTQKIALGDWDTFWLSDTPFEPSKYPGAGNPRVATTAHFTTSAGAGKSFTMINTHLDDQSAAQRALGLSLVLHRAKYEAIKTGNPIILTGDFNSPPSDDAYKIITGAKAPVALNRTFLERYSWSSAEEVGFENFTMLDLLGHVAPRYRVGGSYATYTGFQPLGDVSEFSRIDYVMVGNNGGWNARSYRVGENLGDNGVYHSDHRPVFADIGL